MDKIIKLLTITSILMVSVSYGQQRPQYTQYMVNSFLLNPAVAGINDNQVIKAGYRTQWVGFEGAPRTFFVSGHVPINKIDEDFARRFRKKLNHHGVGGYIFSDVTGPTSRSGAYLSYAFHLSLTKKVKASMGTFVGVLQNKIDMDNVITADPDNVILSGLQTKFMPDVSLGTWIYSDNVFFGFVVSQLFQNNFFVTEQSGFTSYSKLQNHYFVHTGYNIRVNKDWYVVPSVLYKFVTPIYSHFDVNVKLKYKQIAWIGASYRQDDAVAALIGFMDSKTGLNISYSYDITTSKIRYHSSGSHEIIIGLNIPSKGKVLCPDDFW